LQLSADWLQFADSWLDCAFAKRMNSRRVEAVFNCTRLEILDNFGVRGQLETACQFGSTVISFFVHAGLKWVDFWIFVLGFWCIILFVFSSKKIVKNLVGEKDKSRPKQIFEWKISKNETGEFYWKIFYRKKNSAFSIP
jgi:hypothetical protein